jgi:hypothetical protein
LLHPLNVSLSGRNKKSKIGQTPGKKDALILSCIKIRKKQIDGERKHRRVKIYEQQ